MIERIVDELLNDRLLVGVIAREAWRLQNGDRSGIYSQEQALLTAYAGRMLAVLIAELQKIGTGQRDG